jgi:hypothetical protein
MSPLGKYLVLLGLLLVLVGLILSVGGKYLPFGRLPGDIIIEKENFRFYFPLTTMILVSIGLSLLFTVIRNLFR